MDVPIVKESKDGYEVKLGAGIFLVFVSREEYQVSKFLADTSTAEDRDDDNNRGMRDLIKRMKAIKEYEDHGNQL